MCFFANSTTLLSYAIEITGIFNLGSGTRIRIKDLATLIAKLMGYKDLVFMFEGKRRIGDILVLHADIKGNNAIPGWTPKTSLREGLRKTIEWYAKNII